MLITVGFVSMMMIFFKIAVIYRIVILIIMIFFDITIIYGIIIINNSRECRSNISNVILIILCCNSFEGVAPSLCNKKITNNCILGRFHSCRCIYMPYDRRN